VFFQDGSIGAIDEFLWDFGDGRIGSGEKTTHVYERPGTYTARLTLLGPGGSSEKTCSIEVLPPDRAVADFRGKPLKGRGVLEVAFENLSKNHKRSAWDFGDGATSAEDGPVHVYTTPGLYTVRLSVENDLGKDEMIREKYVKVAHTDEPIADFRAIPREGDAPLEVYFEDSSTGLIKEWSWDFGDLRSPPAERTSPERNTTHVYRTPGRYTVRLKVKGRTARTRRKAALHHRPQLRRRRGRRRRREGPEQVEGKAEVQQRRGKPAGDPGGRSQPAEQGDLQARGTAAPQAGTKLVEKVANVYTNQNKPNGEGPATQVPWTRPCPSSSARRRMRSTASSSRPPIATTSAATTKTRSGNDLPG
jgi:PKD repeat protein